MARARAAQPSPARDLGPGWVRPSQAPLVMCRRENNPLPPQEGGPPQVPSESLRTFCSHCWESSFFLKKSSPIHKTDFPLKAYFSCALTRHFSISCLSGAWDYFSVTKKSTPAATESPPPLQGAASPFGPFAACPGPELPGSARRCAASFRTTTSRRSWAATTAWRAAPSTTDRQCNISALRRAPAQLRVPLLPARRGSTWAARPGRCVASG